MKKTISATIDKKLFDWINSQLKDNLKYRNKSHIIEVALQILKKEAEEKEK